MKERTTASMVAVASDFTVLPFLTTTETPTPMVIEFVMSQFIIGHSRHFDDEGRHHCQLVVDRAMECALFSDVVASSSWVCALW